MVSKRHGGRSDAYPREHGARAFAYRRLQPRVARAAGFLLLAVVHPAPCLAAGDAARGAVLAGGEDL